MYAVKEGHVQVVKVLLEQESLEALVRNKVSLGQKSYLTVFTIYIYFSRKGKRHFTLQASTVDWTASESSMPACP